MKVEERWRETRLFQQQRLCMTMYNWIRLQGNHYECHSLDLYMFHVGVVKKYSENLLRKLLSTDILQNDISLRIIRVIKENIYSYFIVSCSVRARLCITPFQVVEYLMF